MPEYDAEEHDSAEFLCSYAVEFQSYLWVISEGDDKWRKACALFVLMVFDFTEFVKSYRQEDSVLVEVGYRTFGPLGLGLGE